MPVIGFISGGSPGPFAYLVRAFRQGLNESGYVEGRNLVIEFRWAEGQYDRLPGLVADLVHREASVLAATTTPGALAAKAATTTIPIVFATDGDPVRLGLTDSLSRPGGNVTGVTQLNVEVGPKRVELAHELIPAATVIALLVNPTNPLAEAIPKTRKLPPAFLGCSSVCSTPALNTISMRSSKPSCNCTPTRWSSAARPTFRQPGRAAWRAGAALPGARDPPVSRVCRGRRPSELRRQLSDSYRQVGIYTGRILKARSLATFRSSSRPRSSWILNLKTAKALGLEVPPTLLARADEVIE